jgi:hypothetical protein
VTLNVTAPPAQSGFTLGTLPSFSLVPDGTVVSVPIQVTPLNGSTATVTLRSVSHLPSGINVSVSGHTVTLSASRSVPAGVYLLELQGYDALGNIAQCHGPLPVGQPGTGSGTQVDPPSIRSVTSTSDNWTPAALISTVKTNIRIDGSNFGETQPDFPFLFSLDGYNPFDSRTTLEPPGMSQAMIIYENIEWHDTWIKLDVTMPVEAGVGPWQVSVTRVGWIRDYTAAHPPSQGKMQVYDATPVISSVTSSTDGTNTYTIAGTNFGTAIGSVRVCDWPNWPNAFPPGSGPCTQSPAWTPGGISLWGAIIKVALTRSFGASGHYCLKVTRAGTNGNAFAAAPNAGSTAESNCEAIEAPQVIINMKLEQIGPTVINPANNYSEDTTIRVTAVRADTGAIIPDFVGTVSIGEIPNPDGVTLYSRNIPSGAYLPPSVNIIGGNSTFVARSLAGPRSEGAVGAPPVDATIQTTNYPVYGPNLTIPQWIISSPAQIDPLASGRVFDWLQTMVRDAVAKANAVVPPLRNDLAIVLSAVSSYKTDAIAAAGNVPKNHVQKSQITLNPYYTVHRIDGPGLHPCGLPTLKSFQGALYHEARHAYQLAQASIPGNDPDGDYLVGAISVPADDSIPPGDYFLDTTNLRFVCNATADVIDGAGLITLFRFLGPAISDMGPEVGYALEMDAYAFAAKWAK